MDNEDMIDNLIGDVLADHAIVTLKREGNAATRVTLAQTMIDKLNRLMEAAREHGQSL